MTHFSAWWATTDEDLVAGRIRWTELTPPEWRERDERRLMPELKMTGSLQPFEKEYFRKDGSRVPVLIGAATFEEGGNQGVAFVLDLTERKRAEEALGKANTSSVKSSKRYQASSGQRTPTANRPNSISAFWTIAACDLRILSMVVGRHSCTRTTFQKLQGLSLTQFRPELPTRLCTVCVGRTASFVGTMLVVSLCAINRDASSSGMACLLTSMKPRRPKTGYAAAKPIWRKHRG